MHNQGGPQEWFPKKIDRFQRLGRGFKPNFSNCFSDSLLKYMDAAWKYKQNQSYIYLKSEKQLKKGRPADFLCLSAKEWTP